MCDCIDKINKRIEQNNSRLVTCFSMSFAEPRNYRETVALTTEKIDKRNRNKMAAIASYCPFCGERYKPLETK